MKIDEMAAGREIDMLVAEKVMRAVPCGAWRHFTYDSAIKDDGDCEHERCYPKVHGPPAYSTNIGAAWNVIAAIVEDHDLWPCVEQFNIDGKRVWDCVFWDGEELMEAGTTVTASLAICHAALKAVAVLSRAPCNNGTAGGGVAGEEAGGGKLGA